MKITNETHWRTDQLKKIIQRVAKVELADCPAYQKRALRIEIVYTRPADWVSDKTYSTGRASVGGTWVKLRIPREKIDHTDFAYVVGHEFGHTRGLRHDRMNGRRAYDRSVAGNREMYSWAEEYPIDRKPVKEKPSLDVIQAIRASRTELAIGRWQVKLKRAQTALKKLNKRARYYEKVLASKTPKEDK